MQFIYPEFLYALSLLVIPIIIHLFNFKRFKTIYFPDVSFLSEIKQKTQSSSKLKHILVLLSRMALIASMVLAFAQPYWKESGEINKQGKVGVQIYVDNSFSMQSQAKEGSLLDDAKRRALSIINSYQISDRFQLLSNKFTNDPSRWLNKEQAVKKIQSIEIDHQNRQLTEVVDRLLEAELDQINEREIYLISDFQKSNFNLEKTDSLVLNINLVLLEVAENENVSLQDLQFEKPFHLAEQTENLEALVVRHGESEKDKIPVKLFLDNQLKAPLSLNFERDDSVMATLSFQSGSGDIQKGSLVIKDYPITFDDSIYFNYELKRKIRIIHIYDKSINRNIRSLFQGDSLFDYTPTEQNDINYSDLKQASLVIIDELNNISSGNSAALIAFIQNGGNILLIPSGNSKMISSTNQLLMSLNAGQLLDLQQKEQKLGSLNRLATLYKGVFESYPEKLDLPNVNKYWLLSQNNNRISEDLISLKDQSPFLRRYELNKGNLYLFASPLNDSSSSFTRHAIFVPTLYNIALYSQEQKQLYYLLNESRIVLKNIIADESPIHIIGNGIDLIPQQEYRAGNLIINLDNQISKAGHYTIQRSDEYLSTISLNYSREESDFSLMDPMEIEDYAIEQELNIKTYQQENESLNSAIQNSRQGIALWKYFIILALIFMGVEILLLRIFK